MVASLANLHSDACPLRVIVITRSGTLPARGGNVTILEDHEGLFARRYDAVPGTAYLFRPDQHVAARWRSIDPARIRNALARATCTL